MHHYAVRCHGRAFDTWEEGIELWRIVVRACIGARAVCLMFDHIHVLHQARLERRLGRALSGHTRMRLHRGDFPGWGAVSTTGLLTDPKKIRRSERYIHLNPNRARLVAGPLYWRFSTHRDALGLARDAVRPRARDREAYHAYVSSDPTSHVGGTPFPAYEIGDVTLDEIDAAVSEYLRVTLYELRTPGPARTWAVRAAKALGTASLRGMSDHYGLSRSRISRVEPLAGQDLNALRFLLRDPRFPGIPGGRIGWLRVHPY